MKDRTKKRLFTNAIKAALAKKGECKLSRRQKLYVSALVDLLGMASYLVPFLGEIADIWWAMVEFSWIQYAYRNTPFALFGGIEEGIPFVTDWIPGCLLAHAFGDNTVKKG